MVRSRLLLFTLAVIVCLANCEVRLQNVDRKISLNSQLARITETIKLKNSGQEPVDKFISCVYVSPSSSLSLIRYSWPSSKLELSITPTEIPDAPPEALCFSVLLPEVVPAGEAATVNMLAVVANCQVPYPQHIAQGEIQLVTYTDNVYVLSPYQVSAQSTEILLPNGNIKSFTEEKPSYKSENKIKYGRYDSVKPFTAKEMRLHFENPKPFKHVLKLVKEIEVSHWGNIYVEESYEVKNSGSLHKGSFSRLKYAHLNGRTNSFRELKARLPADAHSLYYRDLIGNISTSNTRKTATETVIDFETRFPVMGGWKVDFILGYSVPLKNALFSKRTDGKLRLSMPFTASVEDLYIQELEVRVVLPEGSTGITFSLPYTVEQSWDTKFTYLDVTGRPVLVLRKSSVVPEHGSPLIVDYSMPAFQVLREPLLLISAFAVLFLFAILYNRLEFTISKDDKWLEGQNQEKMATTMQMINGFFDGLEELVTSMDRLLDNMSEVGDIDPALKQKQSTDARAKALETSILEQTKVLEATSMKQAALVRDLLEKGKALLARYGRALVEKGEVMKKTSSYADIAKKMTQTLSGITAAKAEFSNEADKMFAPY